MKVEKVFLRTEHNYDRDAASDESGLECKDESRTQQNFAEEVDINTIVRRFGITGQLPTGIVAPTYASFDEIYDFHTAMNAIAAAGEAFDAMPAQIRAEFNNDPGKFVDFCSDPRNHERMDKMGLLRPKPQQEAAKPHLEKETPEKVSPGPVTTRDELVQTPKPA